MAHENEVRRKGLQGVALQGTPLLFDRIPGGRSKRAWPRLLSIGHSGQKDFFRHAHRGLSNLPPLIDGLFLLRFRWCFFTLLRTNRFKVSTNRLAMT